MNERFSPRAHDTDFSTKEHAMTKDQKRGNREAKKPKAEKAVVAEIMLSKNSPTLQATASKTKR